MRIYDYKGTAMPSLYKFNLWKLLAFSIADLLTMVGTHVKIIKNFWEEITMKKLLALCLCVMLLIGLVACAPTGDSTDAGENTTAAANNADQVQVGYGKVMVTPDESVPLRGYGYTEKRMSTGKWSELYLIAIAVTDTEGNTCIVISTDNCSTPREVYTSASTKISKECGIPAENIIVTAIHQHSCPDLHQDKVASAQKYREGVFIPGLVEVAKQAMDNRAPATVQIQSIETENMNFVRRYLTKDGDYHGTDTYVTEEGYYIEQETPVDNVMQVIKFVRKGQTTADGKEAKDIILVNFQGHPLMGTNGADTNVHADVPGVLREHLEKELDCNAIYITGASGNVEFKTRLKELNKSKDYKDHAKMLANLIIKADDKYTDVELGAVKAAKTTYVGTCDHSRDGELIKAKEAMEHWEKYGDKQALKEKFGYSQWLEPNAIINKSRLGETISFDIFTLSIGDIAFVGAPYEMFDTNGMEIKEGSPFDMTIVCTSANGGNGYIPTALGYSHGCYETNSTQFVSGTGDELRDEYLKLLNGLHG